ncbi:MAG TPA: HAMP domain-containing sensor histidine kinase [Cytophagaceae bacterium]|nr:HAMP domain-containing sensor histidine kinase [Cytophagaceae bacterium]
MIRDGVLKRIYAGISYNGIHDQYSQNNKEKLVTFNWQVMICILVSLEFILLGIFSGLINLALFAFTYGVLFTATYLFHGKGQLNVARCIYLFTTNYSVFTISYCIGYEAGFYLYFYTTPLTVYATFDNSKSLYLYLALLSYVANAILLNVLYHQGYLPNAPIFSDKAIILLFNLNFLLAFFMIFMFMGSFVKINIIKTKEAEDLSERQRLLETAIYRKELDETKAQFQYKKLESEYQQLDMFNHIISHNLRGPISRVIGLVDLLKKYPHKGPEEQKLMEHMNTSVLMMDDIIKDLNYILVQKKLGHEKTNLVSLYEVLQEVKLHLSNEIHFSAAEIHDHLFVEKVNCIKSIMVSIFYNLISNSIKYAMPGTNPVIHIIARITEGKLVLTFRDNGVGFDTQKYGHKIFRLYSRFHEHVEGKGMGLFLVKSHVEMLEGKIELESTPWAGATFTVILPLQQ